MRALTFIYLAFMLFLLNSACSPFLQIYSEEEPGINLYKYRTYNWLDNLQVEKDNIPSLLNAETEKTIRASVDAHMRQYGFKQCDYGPDLMLHFHIIVKNKEVYYEDWCCDDETWHKYGRCQRLQNLSYQEGTLIVDMIDTQTGNQVWRGVAVGVLENISPEQVNKRIDEAVAAIFKKFPQQPVPGLVNQ